MTGWSRLPRLVPGVAALLLAGCGGDTLRGDLAPGEPGIPWLAKPRTGIITLSAPLRRRESVLTARAPGPGWP